jgi:hypothetical protein
LAWIAALSLAVVGGGLTESAAAREVPAPETMPLHTAVARDLVSVEVTGRGFASGDSVLVHVRRKCAHPLNLTIVEGTVARPINGDFQSMALVRVKLVATNDKWVNASSMSVNDNLACTFLVEGYCRDIGKPAPTRRDKFQIEGPDSADTGVLVRAGRVEATVAIKQAAIWIQREQMSQAQARACLGDSLREPGLAVAIQLASVGNAQREVPVYPPINAANGEAGVAVQVEANLEALRKVVGKLRADAQRNRETRGGVGDTSQPETRRQGNPPRANETRRKGKILAAVGNALRQIDKVDVEVGPVRVGSFQAGANAGREVGSREVQGREVEGREVEGREVQSREVQSREVEGRGDAPTAGDFDAPLTKDFFRLEIRGG